MIPTGPVRAFPYSDYHDLNLDFLLEQIRLVLVDLEELKRRVKALEDWKIIIESDIVDIKATITLIQGDITIIKTRINNLEKDISEIGSVILTDDSGDISLTVNDEELSIDNVELLKDYLKRDNEEKPTHISTFLYGNGSSYLIPMTYSVSLTGENLDVHFYIDNDTYISTYYVHQNGNEFFIDKLADKTKNKNFCFELCFVPNNTDYYEVISEGDYTRKYILDLYNPILNPNKEELPSDAYVEETDYCDIVFRFFTDHEDYSEYFSDYVKCIDPDSVIGSGSLGYLEIITKDFPAGTDNIYFNVYVTKGNSETLM